MMKAYFHPLAWPVGLLFLAHQFSQHILNLQIPFLDMYFDPFCLGVVCLYLLEVEHNFWYGKETISFIETTIAILFLAFVSEYAFPRISDEFTADKWDVIAIAIGGFSYYSMNKIKNQKEKLKG